MPEADIIEKEFLRDFVRRLGDAWRSRDPDAIVALCAEDVVWDIPVVPEPLVGRVAAREWLAGFFNMVPDVTFEFPVGEPLISLDRRSAAAAWRWRGTMLGVLNPPGFAPTNGVVEDQGMETYEFEGGMVTRYTMLFDSAHFARQIGAMPPPGSVAESFGIRLQRLAAWKLRRSQ